MHLAKYANSWYNQERKAGQSTLVANRLSQETNAEPGHAAPVQDRMVRDMIDTAWVATTIANIQARSDEEQDAVLAQLQQLRAARQRDELKARYRTQMDGLEAGSTPVYTYNPDTGEIDPTPVYKKYRVVRDP